MEEIDKAEKEAIARVVEQYRQRGIPLQTQKPKPNLYGRIFRLFNPQQYAKLEEMWMYDGSDIVRMSIDAIKADADKARITYMKGQ